MFKNITREKSKIIYENNRILFIEYNSIAGGILFLFIALLMLLGNFIWMHILFTIVLLTAVYLLGLKRIVIIDLLNKKLLIETKFIKYTILTKNYPSKKIIIQKTKMRYANPENTELVDFFYVINIHTYNKTITLFRTIDMNEIEKLFESLKIILNKTNKKFLYKPEEYSITITL